MNDKKFKAVICGINAKYIHSSLAPWCLLAGVKEYAEKTDAVVVEGTINEKEEEIKKRILKENPTAVGFGCYIWNIKRVLSIAKSIREEKPSVKIILGGPEVSFNATEILSENAFVDYVISGQGEKAFAKLLVSVSKGEEPSLNEVSFRTEEGINEGSYQIFEGDLSPYTEEYFEKLSGRIAYIESSRGCPYSCSFCLSGRDKKVRFFDLERIKKEILLLASSGTQTVKFVDRTFNCNKTRALSVLSFIKDNYGSEIPASVCFHFEIAADILDGDFLSLVSQMPSGSVQFEVGIQSFNEKTLDSINRKTNLLKLSGNVEKLVSFAHCHIHTDLIAGLPFEDYTLFKDSFNKAYGLYANMLQLGFLKVLHGSAVEKDKDKYSLVFGKEPPYEVIETPWLSKEDLKRLHLVEDALERLYNSGRFKRTLSYVLSVCGKTPFDLFEGMGVFTDRKNVKRPALDLYTGWAFEYFSTLEGVCGKTLRDKMLEDRISTNTSGVIPDCLKVYDEKLSVYKRKLSYKYPLAKGEKRSVGVLYSENMVLFCDYTEKDRVSGEYTVKKVSLTEFEI